MPPTVTSSLAPRQPSKVVSPPALPLGQSLDAASQDVGVGDAAGVRTTSGPLRHPKPLTASDIHSVLEQEQEAMINRLSRELSLLRQQTASVASTASSTSTTFNDSLDALHGSSSYITGPIQPTASRRHRSSSNLSSSYFPVIQGSRTSSCMPPTRTTDSSRSGRSREPSFASSQHSESAVFSHTSQPHLQKQIDPSTPVSHSPYSYTRRTSLSQQRTRSGSGVFRYEEGASQRWEMEALKRENDLLRRRILDLELELSAQRSQTQGSTDSTDSSPGLGEVEPSTIEIGA